MKINMAYYAFLDKNNIVTEVITGCEEDQLVDGVTDWEEWYGNFRGQKCKRTSYNTFQGQHNMGKTQFRKNFAGIGFSYDDIRDAFIPPKPYRSWILDEERCDWIPPIPYPNDSNNIYYWDEEQLDWVIVPNYETKE